MSYQVCKNCKQYKDAHCVFDPMDVPDSCVCDHNEWGDEIPEPCDKYVGPGGKVDCETCEHDEACHTKKVKPCKG